MNRNKDVFQESLKDANYECLNIIFSDYTSEFLNEIKNTPVEKLIQYLVNTDGKYSEAEAHIFHYVMMNLRLNKYFLPSHINNLELIFEKALMQQNRSMIFYIEDYFSSYNPSPSRKIYEAEARILNFIETFVYLTKERL